MKKVYIIATIKPWNIAEAKKFIGDNPKLNILLITDKAKLTFKRVKKINPEYLFFPHWSWIIPKKIYQSYKCVGFHMTDLPFGRGGSPLQNLIERGFGKTKISAFKITKGLDAGPIYLKKNLSLTGTANQIFKRASGVIFKSMVRSIIRNDYIPMPQIGRVVKFQRRTFQQSDISRLNSLKKIYDYIRMLDVQGYPLAFLELPYYRVEFLKANLKKNNLIAQVKISLRRKK